MPKYVAPYCNSTTVCFSSVCICYRSSLITCWQRLRLLVAIAIISSTVHDQRRTDFFVDSHSPRSPNACIIAMHYSLPPDVKGIDNLPALRHALSRQRYFVVRMCVCFVNIVDILYLPRQILLFIWVVHCCNCRNLWTP